MSSTFEGEEKEETLCINMNLDIFEETKCLYEKGKEMMAEEKANEGNTQKSEYVSNLEKYPECNDPNMYAHERTLCLYEKGLSVR
jgi:predicted transcriptional regulator YheO